MNNIPVWYLTVPSSFWSLQSLQQDGQQVRLLFCTIRIWKANSYLDCKQVIYSFFIYIFKYDEYFYTLIRLLCQ